MKNGRRARRGLTLMEVVLALSILVGIGGGIYVATSSLSSAFRTGTSLATLDTLAHQGLSKLVERLEQAGGDTLFPVTSDPIGGEEAIEFQRALGFEAGGVVWGPTERIAREPSPSDPDDGLDNDGNGLVDEGQLVWTERLGQPDEERHVLVRWVAEAAEGEDLTNGLDDNANGLADEGGFSLAFDARTITIRLTLERAVTSAVVTRRTFERTVAFHNEGGAGE